MKILVSYNKLTSQLKMLFLKNFLKKIPSKNFSTNIFEKTLTVPTFCKLLINVPYNVNLTPLDVYQYPNCDKILIKINKNIPLESSSFQCEQINDEILIKDSNNEDLICDIQAPIKADLSVKTEHGNVNISNFNGDNIEVSSGNGNVVMDKYNGENLKISCGNGDVNFRGIIQASNIDVRIKGNGSISTEKLQGLKTKLQTKTGNINVNSSYCNESEFSTENGNLTLKNIHKLCKVTNSSGHIKIVGMDGQLELFQKNGKSDVQLSRIVDFSKIRILNGSLNLGISEEIRENVKIRCATLQMHENLLEYRKNYDDYTMLQFSEGNVEKLYVDCGNCDVSVQFTSWSDMMKQLKF